MSKRSKVSLALSMSVIPLALRAEAMYRYLPRLQPVANVTSLPSLSIIVPARNEGNNLRRLLPSLNEQVYAGEMELIVVDDQSADDTACVASRYGAKVIPAGELPPGWLGKPHASHIGAQAASGEWLLFTDSDTCHARLSAATAVTYALDQGLDGLSIFPHQEMYSLFNQAVMTVAFAGLFASLRRTTPTLNGQYLLIHREVYERSGGFAAVRKELMDDLAYGRLLAKHGFRVPVMHGEDLAQVFMYANWRHMWSGMVRLGSGSMGWSWLQAVVPFIFITGAMMPLWMPIFERQSLREERKIWVIWIMGLISLIPWSRHFGTVWGALLAPFGALFVQLAAVWGLVSRLLGRGVSWKTRKV
jgi:cellulose synthase/poly-beta-1,6-N-acetylglucosamine synthase-like glycosyltransferase